MLWSLRAGRVRGARAGTPLGVTTVDMSLARLKDCLNRAVTKKMVTMNVASELSIRVRLERLNGRPKLN